MMPNQSQIAADSYIKNKPRILSRTQSSHSGFLPALSNRHAALPYDCTSPCTRYPTERGQPDSRTRSHPQEHPSWCRSACAWLDPFLDALRLFESRGLPAQGSAGLWASCACQWVHMATQCSPKPDLGEVIWSFYELFAWPLLNQSCPLQVS